MLTGEPYPSHLGSKYKNNQISQLDPNTVKCEIGIF